MRQPRRFQGSGTGVPPVRSGKGTHGRDARATTVSKPDSRNPTLNTCPADRNRGEQPWEEAVTIGSNRRSHFVRRVAGYLLSAGHIFNLPYCRFLIGRTLLAAGRRQVKNLRYSRLQVCATGAADTLNTYSTVCHPVPKPLKRLERHPRFITGLKPRC